MKCAWVFCVDYTNVTAATQHIEVYYVHEITSVYISKPSWLSRKITVNTRKKKYGTS
jgi:hypothetical protein